MKITHDIILKFAAIYLKKVANFDILQALVKAKQKAPPELLPILDKIALMIDNVHEESEEHIERFISAVSGIAADYYNKKIVVEEKKKKEETWEDVVNEPVDGPEIPEQEEQPEEDPVLYFLNGVSSILNGYLMGSHQPTPEEIEEEQANPFNQIQEQQDIKADEMMAKRRTTNLEWFNNYMPEYRKKVKIERPEMYQKILDREKIQKSKRDPKIHNEKEKLRYKNLTPEQKADKAVKDKLRLKTRREELKRIQLGIK